MKDLEKSITTLKNGTKVANFSSPHIYTFEDGSKLAKCDIREAGLFKVHFREKVVKDIRDIAGIEMDFMLSKALLSRMNMWEQLYNDKKVDVVISDMAVNTSGNKNLDSIVTGELCLDAMRFARYQLKQNGYFISKIFMGSTFNEIISEAK